LAVKCIACRTNEEALLWRAIVQADGLVLTGVEGYAGLLALVSDDRDVDQRGVKSFLAN